MKEFKSKYQKTTFNIRDRSVSIRGLISTHFYTKAANSHAIMTNYSQKLPILRNSAQFDTVILTLNPPKSPISVRNRPFAQKIKKINSITIEN